MAAFNVFFLAILSVIAVVIVWAVWSAVALLVAKRKLRTVMIGLPVSTAVVVAGVALSWFASTRPTAVFKNEFGFALPADTRILDSSSFALGDSGSAYVVFRTS